MKYIYREINIKDYKNIISLWRETPGIGISSADSKDNISRFLERNKGLCFICEFNDNIVGTILCGHDGRRGYIYHMCVHDNHRRKGIGKKLVSLSLENMKSCGIEKCHIYVFGDNYLGISFWKKTGWKKRDDLFMFSKVT